MTNEEIKKYDKEIEEEFGLKPIKEKYYYLKIENHFYKSKSLEKISQKVKDCIFKFTYNNEIANKHYEIVNQWEKVGVISSVEVDMVREKFIHWSVSDHLLVDNLD